MTVYPSIDKPWLKYFPKEATSVRFPEGSMYEFLRDCNLSEQDDVALVYFGKKITYNNPGETDKVLIRHADGILWLHSGDLGHMDENGNVFLEGRLKRLIVQHEGFKIPPVVLEETICKHPTVSACCVVGMPDREHGFGQLPVAFVVLHENAKLEENELRKLCERELAPKYQPREYRIVPALPLTANGKVDYRLLEKEVAQ